MNDEQTRLQRLIEILSGQLLLSEATGARAIAVPVDDVRTIVEELARLEESDDP